MHVDRHTNGQFPMAYRNRPCRRLCRRCLCFLFLGCTGVIITFTLLQQLMQSGSVKFCAQIGDRRVATSISLMDVRTSGSELIRDEPSSSETFTAPVSGARNCEKFCFGTVALRFQFQKSSPRFDLVLVTVSARETFVWFCFVPRSHAKPRKRRLHSTP